MAFSLVLPSLRSVWLVVLMLCTAVLAPTAAAVAAVGRPLPTPQVDLPLSVSQGSTAVAVLAGGCFWGTEAVFEHVKGVKHVISGYTGGPAAKADYPSVSSGESGHAESIQITYDPAQVSYGQLLRVFFAVAHNPTQLNYQGPDHGPQYRSAIFFNTPDQARVAKAYITQLQEAKSFEKPIVTQLTPLGTFYPAEAYHQEFLNKHPDHPYIVAHDLPKLRALQQAFPEWYVTK